MTNEFVLRDNELTPGGVRATLRKHGWTWKSTGACIGLRGGLIAPLVGLALTTLAWFVGDWHGFHFGRSGTILFLLTIPLLILGAHCLDLLDKENERAKKGEGNDMERD
jgi:hypothetical protein